MKERVYVGGGQPPLQTDQQGEDKGTLSRQVAIAAIWAGIGFASPSAVIYGGMSPFGVGVVAAASGVGQTLVCLLTAVGYIAAHGVTFPFRYMAAVLAVAGIRWAVAGLRPLTSSKLFAPITAGLATAVTGVATLSGGGLDGYDVLLIGAESLLSAGFAWFCEVAMGLFGQERTTTPTMAEQTAVMLIGSVVLMALSGFTVGDISPGRIAAVVAVLLMARSGKEQGGGMAGILLGVVMMLGFPSHTYIAATYAFGGLLAGVFARFGRIASAVAFFTAGLMMVLNAGTQLIAIVGLYEVIGGCILFIATPPSIDRKLNRFFARAHSLPAVEGLRRSVVMRLDVASRAMDEVAGTVTKVSQKLAGISAPDLGGVYRKASNEVCHACGLQGFCWGEHYGEAMDAFSAMTPLLQEHGHLERGQITGHLAKHCSRADALVQQVNRFYTEHLVRESAWQRLSEIQEVVTDQFSATADLLQELSRDFSAEQPVDTDAASRVRDVCEQYGFRLRDAVCFIGRGGRMTVEILTADTRTRLDESAWMQAMENACGRVFDHPAVVRMGDDLKITLCEKPRYRVEVGVSQLTCSGEKLCGDAYDAFADGTGRQFVLISDGMGSGGRAAVDGAMAAGLATRLIQAGLAADSVLRLINTALMVKSEDESLATLDIAAIDLYSGRIDSLKAGASTSLLRSMGRVSRIEQASMPIGILKETAFARSHDTLVNGDILVLMSDGAVTHGLGWVEEWLRDFDDSKQGMTRLAEEIAAEARRRQQGSHEDDITVIALQMHKQK